MEPTVPAASLAASFARSEVSCLPLLHKLLAAGHVRRHTPAHHNHHNRGTRETGRAKGEAVRVCARARGGRMRSIGRLQQQLTRRALGAMAATAPSADVAKAHESRHSSKFGDVTFYGGLPPIKRNGQISSLQGRWARGSGWGFCACGTNTRRLSTAHLARLEQSSTPFHPPGSLMSILPNRLTHSTHATRRGRFAIPPARGGASQKCNGRFENGPSKANHCWEDHPYTTTLSGRRISFAFGGICRT